MDYLYETLDRPARLYIKKCSHCDLKYFGKTVSEDIEKYPGSGLYWNKHLKKYNAKSIHLWNSDWYYDTSISRFALKFSYMNHIAESKTWANMIPENGLDNGVGYFSFLGKKHSDETKEVMSEKAKLRSGSKNSQYGTIWITNGAKNRKIKKNNSIPKGWKRGAIYSPPNIKKEILFCKECEYLNELNYWVPLFRNSNLSYRKFIEEYNFPNAHPRLIKMNKEYESKIA